MQFYNISDTDGTMMSNALVHGDSITNDSYYALTTYDSALLSSWKGMGIRSNDGAEFQINGFFYSNWGDGQLLITVEGYRDGLNVANTSFLADEMVNGFISKTVALDSTFDNVDTVLLYSNSTSWHGINDIVIEKAAPTVTTNAASGITSSGAGLIATVNDNGTTTTVSFDYGTTMSYGSNAAATTGGTVSEGAGSTSATVMLAGLTPNTTYHYRVKAQNDGGISYGSDETFTTSVLSDTTAPTLSGVGGSSVTQTTANVSAMSDEDATMYYVITTSSTSPSVTQVIAGQNNSGTLAVKSGSGPATANTAKDFNVTGLTAGTQYYVYFVAKDSSNNESSVGNTNFTTTAAQAAPRASGVSIMGTAQVGQTLTGGYAYSDVNSDVEGTSGFKWYRSDDASGTNKTAISGATSSTYALQAADLGKYLSFEMTPVAQTGTATGTAVESSMTSAVERR